MGRSFMREAHFNTFLVEWGEASTPMPRSVGHPRRCHLPLHSVVEATNSTLIATNRILTPLLSPRYRYQKGQGLRRSPLKPVIKPSPNFSNHKTSTLPYTPLLQKFFGNSIDFMRRGATKIKFFCCCACY